MKPIFLIGYMAAGKTTLGKALARQLNMQFIDLDFYIEQRFHTTIADFFANRGEDAFRKVEKSMLQEVGEFCDVVISAGGGTPCFFDNMDYMLSRGTVVWLQANEECIARRIMQRPGKRPLMTESDHDTLIENIRSGLRDRSPFYSRANIHFNAEKLESRQEIAQTLESFLPLL